MNDRIIKIMTVTILLVATLGFVLSSSGEAGIPDDSSAIDDGGDTVYETIYIKRKDDGGGYNSQPLSYFFEPGKTYIFTVDKIEILDGETAGVTVALYNNTKGKFVDDIVFDFPDKEKTRLNGEYVFTVPNTNDKYRLYLYAGIKECTFGIEISYEGIHVKEYNEEGN